MRCISTQKHRVGLLLTTSNTVPICQKGYSDIDSIIIIKYLYLEYIILPDFRSVIMQ